MDLQSLQQQLLKELQQDQHIELKQCMHYSIPIHTIEVSYHPVMRSAMDILMKMMLLSFQKAKLKNVELLADILLVEPLFIHDLTNKMIRLGMIEKGEHYSLTAKGEDQLLAGIFEEELELTSNFLQFSPLHHAVLEGDIEAFTELEEFPEAFPYMESEEIEALEESLLIEKLQQLIVEENGDQEIPTFITSITSTESIQINDIPILCFILYHQKQQLHFVRVYNTLTNAWDEQLEAIVHEHEKLSWAQ
jgi:hypothetical protein